MDKPQFDSNDGFHNLPDSSLNLEASTRFEHLFTQEFKIEQPKRNVKNVIKMEVVEPQWEIQKTLYKGFFFVGQKVKDATIQTVNKVPGLIHQGYTALYSIIANRLKQVPAPEQIKEDYDPSKEPIVIVMPQEIIDSDIPTQDKWLEEHKETLSVFYPRKDFQLKGPDDKSDSSDGPDGLDYDMRRISQEFPNILNIESLSNTYFISENDLQRLSTIRSEIKADVYTEKQNEKNANMLYPFLPQLYRRSIYEKQYEEIQQSQHHKNPMTLTTSFVNLVEDLPQPPQQQIEEPLENVIQNPQFVPLAEEDKFIAIPSQPVKQQEQIVENQKVHIQYEQQLEEQLLN